MIRLRDTILPRKRQVTDSWAFCPFGPGDNKHKWDPQWWSTKIVGKKTDTPVVHVIVVLHTWGFKFDTLFLCCFWICKNTASKTDLGRVLWNWPHLCHAIKNRSVLGSINTVWLVRAYIIWKLPKCLRLGEYTAPTELPWFNIGTTSLLLHYNSWLFMTVDFFEQSLPDAKIGS